MNFRDPTMTSSCEKLYSQSKRLLWERSKSNLIPDFLLRSYKSSS